MNLSTKPIRLPIHSSCQTRINFIRHAAKFVHAAVVLEHSQDGSFEGYVLIQPKLFESSTVLNHRVDFMQDAIG